MKDDLTVDARQRGAPSVETEPVESQSPRNDR